MLKKHLSMLDAPTMSYVKSIKIPALTKTEFAATTTAFKKGMLSSGALSRVKTKVRGDGTDFTDAASFISGEGRNDAERLQSSLAPSSPATMSVKCTHLLALNVLREVRHVTEDDWERIVHDLSVMTAVILRVAT